ncbi:MAG: hypothetical protein H6737_04885 [Alphaproteobacteria bacterium]|nr:hypothetical protein [Alphaproteobacteria bacterium]
MIALVQAAWSALVSVQPGDLQTSLDAASPGDVLVVAEGLHTGPFAVSVPVLVVADPTRSAPVVLSASTGPVVTVSAAAHLVDVEIDASGVVGLVVDAGGVVLDGVRIHDASGGSVRVVGGDLVVVGSWFEDATAASGAHIDASSPVEVYGSGFVRGSAGASGRGGAIRVVGADLTVADTTFEQNGVGSGGAGGALAFLASGADVTLGFVASRVVGNSATNGGGVYLESGSFVSTGSLQASFEDCSFEDNQAGTGGGGVKTASLASTPLSAAFERTRFCGNVGTVGAGVASQSGSEDLAFRHVVFSKNRGSALRVGGPTTVEHSLFIANEAAEGSAIFASFAEVAIASSIFVGNTGHGAADYTNMAPLFDHVLFDNDDDGTAITSTTSDLSTVVLGEDPLLTGVTDCPVLEDLGLAPGSPAIDAGDPLSPELDGTAPDLGPSGGDPVPCAVATVFRDLDGDGYGDPIAPYTGCGQPPGYVADGSDCDDLRASVSPAGSESCNGLDDDCSGVPDDTGPTWYEDADQDGWGGPDSVLRCTQPAGYLPDGGDCDDADPFVSPDALEVPCTGVDEDCDPGSPDLVDADGDGAACDCDETDPDVFPGAVETCDLADEDCDGLVDEGFDVDGDGVTSCGGDCDDADDEVAPGLAEVDCDGRDNDCDPSTPDRALEDADGDGANACIDCDDGDATAAPGLAEVACDGVDNDCDPLTPRDGPDTDGDGDPDCSDCAVDDPDVHHGAAEVCDGADQDCDGAADDGLTFRDWWPDADGDGFGDASVAATSTCDGAPEGSVGDGTDCDDDDASVHPDAADAGGDGVDQDCDGADGPAGDADGDGFPAGTDCDDADPTVFPGAVEDAGPVDRDCDGYADPTGRLATCGCASDALRGFGLAPLLLALVRRRRC